MTECNDLAAEAFRVVREDLLAERGSHGHWVGELSSSALSTATASFALHLVHRSNPETRLQAVAASGVDWLASKQNSDGGWGDTVRSLSNISTTTLCWAALSAVAPERHAAAIEKGRHWIAERAGSCEPDALSDAIIARYGKDRTFSIPILTMCALAGQLGEGRDAWKRVLPLPFELAALPHRWYAIVGLPVVSYALPALIAIGQAHHHHRPTRWLPWRWIRNALIPRTLRTLDSIQPSTGGFLEATPLTSFVTMSLAGIGRANHPVAREGVRFLIESVRDDGSWPIDTNLATWCTTLSVNALADSGVLESSLDPASRKRISEWLLGQQYREVHPYTNAAPGGWAWTDLPGGVPDADDTPSALIALHHLDDGSDRYRESAEHGVRWLLDLQNRDGGIPTFCRGWGKLPFDRSGADLTAQVLRAWSVWSGRLADSGITNRLPRASERALDYLVRTQRDDGSWTPLWFGNENAPDDINPTYGTAKVLRALEDLRSDRTSGAVTRARAWLTATQHTSGGWGGCANTRPSIEETALALEALQSGDSSDEATNRAIQNGRCWLAEAILDRRHQSATPIGFYFAKLWYYEKLYPLIYATSALGT